MYVYTFCQFLMFLSHSLEWNIVVAYCLLNNVAHKNVHSSLKDKYLTESLLLVFFHSILTFHHAMCCQMTKRKKLKRQQHFIQYFSYSTSHVLLLLKILFIHCQDTFHYQEVTYHVIYEGYVNKTNEWKLIQVCRKLREPERIKLPHVLFYQGHALLTKYVCKE